MKSQPHLNWQTIRVTIGLLLLSMTFFAPLAAADGDLKKKVFDDCDGAKAALPGLAEEQRLDFIQYLGRVLEMQGSSSLDNFFEAAGAIPGGPPIGVGGGQLGTRDQALAPDMWRTLKPIREADAKRCALSLLSEISPTPTSVLPGMIESAEDQSLPADLRTKLAAAAWAFTLKAKAEVGNKLEESTILNIVKLLPARSGYLARNTLVELYKDTVGPLTKLLLNPDERRRDDVTAVLRLIDESGEFIGPSILPLLTSSDADARLRSAQLLGGLAGFHPTAFPEIIRRLGDPEPKVEEALYAALSYMCKLSSANIAQGLKQAYANVPSNRENELLQKLLRELPNQDRNRREVLEKALQLVGPSVPRLEEFLLPLLNNEDIDLRTRGIRLLGFQSPATLSTLEHISSHLYDQPTAIRLAAIKGLKKLQLPDKDRIPPLLRMLKSMSKDPNPISRQALILSTADALETFSPDSTLRPFVPYLIEGLSFYQNLTGSSPASITTDVLTENSALSALVRLGKLAEADLVKSLGQKDPIVCARAARAISRIPNPNATTIKSLIYLLSDREPLVSTEAERALERLGPAAVPELEKALSSATPAVQLGAAKVLARLDIKNPKIAAVLQDAIIRLSCQQRPEVIRLQIRVNPELNRAWAQEMLISCLMRDSNDKEALLQVLIDTAPLDESSLRQVLALIGNRMISRTIRLRCAEEGLRFGMKGQSLAVAVLQLLKESDQTMRARIIQILANLGPAAALATEDLKLIAENNNEEPNIRVRAGVALAAIDPKFLDSEKLLTNELGSDRAAWAEAALLELDAEYAVPILRNLLKALSEKPLQRIITLLGSFGERAKDVVPDLIPFLDNEDAEIRFLALRTLLQVDPGAEPALRFLRASLLTEFVDKLAESTFPSGVIPLLEQIVREPKSFVERRGAERLLVRLNSPKPEH